MFVALDPEIEALICNEYFTVRMHVQTFNGQFEVRLTTRRLCLFKEAQLHSLNEVG